VLDDRVYQFNGFWGGGNAGIGAPSVSGAGMVSHHEFCELASSKLGEIRGKDMLSLTPASIHQALRNTSATYQIPADGKTVVIDSGEMPITDDAPASSSAGSEPLSTTAMRSLWPMRRLWQIPLNGKLGLVKHDLYKLWKGKQLGMDTLLLVLAFAHRTFEDIVTAHHAQCPEDHYAPCWHAKRILKLAAGHRTWRSDPETCRFPCHLTSCGGNVMIINHVLPEITPTMGKSGRMVLSESWKVYVAKQKTITADIVKSTLEQFLQVRRIARLLNISVVTPLDDLDEEDYSAVKMKLQHTKSWFRIPFSDTVMQPLSKSNWFERAWHGFKMESLASMLVHGIRDSGPDLPASRHENKEGIYCCGDTHVYRATGYANAVPSGDNLYWSGMWELKVDRNRCEGCKRRGQWIQPAPSVERTALWIRVANFQDISDGESIQAVWEPLFEIPSHGAPF